MRVAVAVTFRDNATMMAVMMSLFLPDLCSMGRQRHATDISSYQFHQSSRRGSSSGR